MKPVPLLLVLATALMLVACDDDPAHRVAAIFSWKREGSTASVARIRAALSDPDAGVRTAALDALVSSGAPDAAAGAVAALDDPDPSVRAVAAKGLGELREASAEARLISILQADPVAQVRRRAADALANLGSLGGDAVASALAESLSDASRDVRLAAARGCAGLLSADCIESLARVILDDPEWDIRVAAARGLGRSGRQEAAGALESATGDPNEFVRAAAASALAALSHTTPAQGPPPAPKSEPQSGNRSPRRAGVYSALRDAIAAAPARRSEIDRGAG